MKKIIAAFCVLTLFASNSFACIKHLKITEVWARSSSAPNNNSAAYMTIENTGEKDVVITGAETDKAVRTELHETFEDEKGVHKMVHVDKIVVPAHTKIELKPKHTHVMLMELKQDLKAGDKFTLKLKSGKGERELEVLVKPLGE